MKFDKVVIFIFVFFLSFLSCKVTRHTAEGLYAEIYRGRKYVPSVYSIILKDSPFRYYYSSGWQKELTFGTWEIEKKKLILQSYIRDVKNIPIIVEESNNDSLSFASFKLENSLVSDTSMIWTININGTDYPMNVGRFTFDRKERIDSFYIRGYLDFTHLFPFPLQETIKSEIYYTKNDNNNFYNIKFYPYVGYNIFHYKPIQDTLKIRRNKLIWKNKKLDLKRQSVNKTEQIKITDYFSRYQ